MSIPIKIYSYNSSSTCKKALKWLDENNIQYQLIDIVSNPPDQKVLQKAIKFAGERKLLFNTRGQSYRRLGAETVRAMTQEEALKELSSDGKLIKRPFLISPSGDFLLGFDESIWRKTLLS